MTLLREIQAATVNPEFRLADVLRKCKILASRLENSAFKDWINQELNGYKTLEQLPDYRILKGLRSTGDFFGGFGSGLKNAPITTFNFSEPFREMISTARIRQAVSSIEHTVVEARQSNKSWLQSPWDANAVAHYGKDIYQDMVCGSAWRDIPTASLVAILDTVKSRILDFVLEIEIEAPNAGEAEAGEKPLPEGTVNQIFYGCILNSGANLQTSSQGIDMSENYENNLQGANVANMANI